MSGAAPAGPDAVGQEGPRAEETGAGAIGGVGGPIRVAVLTVSDGVTTGHRQDRSGAAIAEWARARGHRLQERAVVPDEIPAIAAALRSWTDAGAADLIVTTGGTGFTVRDVTPEATAPLIERDAPGLADAIRRRGEAHTPYAALSRGVAGIRGRTLIVNLPGSTGGVRDGLAVLDGVIEHAVELLRGEAADHTPPDRRAAGASAGAGTEDGAAPDAAGDGSRGASAERDASG